MRKIIAVLLTVAIGCSPKTGDQSADANVTAVENSLGRQVHFEDDELWSIDARMKHYGVPGVSIAVIKDNKIIWAKAYGIMDKETNELVTTKTLFQAGSISKPVAAYGALKTVEMGKVSLTEDVNNYLTSWKLPDSEFTKDKKVTLEHLVSHTGGLTVHGFLGYSPDLPVPTAVQVLDGAPPANSPPVRVDKSPGTGFRYSGGGYTVMQQMMVDVHGKTFPEIEKELVLKPLDMDNSTYDQPLDQETVKFAATGYLPNHEQTKGKRHTYPEMAAAGLWTTAEDLAKFAIDIQKTLKGESSKVLSKEMAMRMVTPVKNEKSIGLGIFMEDHDGEIYFGHGGWDEGFSSNLIAHRDKGYGVVVLTNSNHPAFIDELIRSVARVYAWDNYTTNYNKMPIDPLLFSSITGRYSNGGDGLISITREGDKLFFKNLRADSPTELFRITDSTYLTMYENTPMQFKPGPDGSVKMIRYADRAITHDKLKDDEKVPYEYLLEGEYRKALKGYKDLKKKDPNDNSVSEDNLNSQGYRQLEAGNNDLARNIFKINVELYPDSFNVYDSYADACRKSGDNKEAIANYKKALKINPKNEDSARKLAELENISK
jgi:CubicO group peptidase (beta-lactamase class C family)